MRLGPEHGRGWRASFEIGGERFQVEARHYTRRRMPRGHEIARQAARGGQWQMVEETDYEWAVTGRGRMVCVLRQAPSGDFASGHALFERRTILQAAEAAVRFYLPRLGSLADSGGTPEATDGNPGPGRS